MISMPLTEIERRANLWAESTGGTARVIDGESLIGGGSLPGATLPTRLVAIGDPTKPAAANRIAVRLRLQDPPVVGRVSENILLLDPRTVPPGEDEVMIENIEYHQELEIVRYRYCRSCRPR